MAARNVFDDGMPEDVRTLRQMQDLHAKPEGGQPGIYWMDAAFIEELRPE